MHLRSNAGKKFLLHTQSLGPRNASGRKFLCKIVLQTLQKVKISVKPKRARDNVCECLLCLAVTNILGTQTSLQDCTVLLLVQEG